MWVLILALRLGKELENLFLHAMALKINIRKSLEFDRKISKLFEFQKESESVYRRNPLSY